MNTPGFPERLREVVIEAVHHTGKTPGQHIVLEVLGCTACENEKEDHVEWGGMLSVDETGSYRKMYNSSVQGTLCESESNKAKIKAKHWLRIIVSLCASL